MKPILILIVSVIMLSGCVSHTSCHVIEAPDHADVTLSLNVYGIVPGICGFTTHSGYDYTLRLLGQKETYRAHEVQDITATHQAILFDGGSIAMSRDCKRIVVKLDEHGHPFEFNGKYHYK
jgi:hypothetical protein